MPGDPGGEGDDLVKLEGKGDGAKGLDNKRNTLVEPAGKVDRAGEPTVPLDHALAQSLLEVHKDERELVGAQRRKGAGRGHKDVTEGTGFGKPMSSLGSSLAQSLAGGRKDVESDAEDLGGSGEDGDDGKDLEGVGGDGELL